MRLGGGIARIDNWSKTVTTGQNWSKIDNWSKLVKTGQKLVKDGGTADSAVERRPAVRLGET